VLRKVTGRVGLEPSYLSKIERGQESPPGEQTIRRLAEELSENPDALLALAGKVSSGLLAIIRERPTVAVPHHGDAPRLEHPHLRRGAQATPRSPRAHF
jgi:transcriptional regulator with XRE-family HTH domain